MGLNLPYLSIPGEKAKGGAHFPHRITFFCLPRPHPTPPAPPTSQLPRIHIPRLSVLLGVSSSLSNDGEKLMASLVPCDVAVGGVGKAPSILARPPAAPP